MSPRDRCKSFFFCHRKKIKIISLTLISVFIFILFFNKFFLKGQLLSAGSFLYLWYPWAKARPENLEGIQNFILSDWVDSLVPALTYVKNVTLKLIFSGYSFRSNWGTSSNSIVGVINIHEPLTMFFIKIFNVHLGSTLLFISKSVLAFIGSVLLFRELKLNRYIALLSSFSFAFSVPIISFIHGGTTISTVALTFLLFSVFRLVRKHTVKNILLYVIFTVWLVTTGFPSTIMYGVIFSFILFVFLIITNRNLNKKKKAHIILFFTLINLLILGIWAWSILPNVSSLNNFDLGYREGYGARRLHRSHFLQWVYPNYCGNATTMGWVCDSNWIETSTSSGIISLIVLFLGLPAIIFKHRNRKFFLYFLVLLCISFCLIFNIGNLTAFVGKLPLFSISPSTRLVFIIPLFVTITGAVSFDIILKKFNKREDRLKILLFLVVIGIALVFIIAKNLNILAGHLRGLDRASLIGDLKQFISVSFLGLFLLLLTLFVKNKNLRKIFLILLSLIAAFDLYYYNSKFMPYQKKEEIFPVTEGIEFLQENMNQEDRILAIGRVFLPNTNYYYGINSLTGHDWRTKAFNEAMQPIEVGIFEKASTMQFFNRERVLLTSEGLKNYLRFNRVKYIVQAPSSLEPEKDPLFIQPYISDYLFIEKPIKYTITLDREEALQFLELNGQCNIDENEILRVEDIKISVIDNYSNPTDIPVLNVKSSCLSNDRLQIQTPKVYLEEGSAIELEIRNSRNWKLATYSIRDLRKDTTLEGNEEIFELVGRIYSENENSDKYKEVYNGGDLLIHEVSDQTSVAYFYSCAEFEKKECIERLKNFKISDPKDLSQFGKIFEGFEEIPFDNYSEGKMSLDTSKINSSGVIILTDNYFKGWHSSEGEVFEGFLGTLNIFVTNPGDTTYLDYTNEYLLPGIIISVISSGMFLGVLFLSKKKGLLLK